ncbi:hypothetical protein RchiOBHm_Chr6g0310851 [Rosa chinensis]|uniref:Uncharacterized protein n=1 Tax=Rosa chinensis TaxID=74649 RepID=A0A2P6Q184_ROSCH|nr:uncharacterized protein LOC112169283 isoform X1 [Rosa chinensis]PRQ27952.1 hypothetical protein RchiOBHm_Chr6g0310851 [Rosa chinensis]
MADKPSRALVLYGDGLAPFVNPSHTRLHSLASKASCGFLSLPNAPPSESEDERIVREFAVLVDAYEAYTNTSGSTTKEEGGEKSTISERFMGMKAAIVTNNSNLKSFGTKLGFSVLPNDGFIKSSEAQAELPVDSVASELLKLLGFQEGKTLESSRYDLVFVHVGAGEVNVKNDKAIADDVEYPNALIGAIMNIGKPGTEISLRLHLSVVMSYGGTSEKDDPDLSFSISKDNSNLSKLVPHQSYTMKGEVPRKDVRHHSPMLLAQWQYAVTRKDMAETFSFKDFKEHGGNLVIPADRFLHEVAFKLWKAPKYGA